jgi:hypothetical protein
MEARRWLKVEVKIERGGWGTRVPRPEDPGYRKVMRPVRSQAALRVLDLTAPQTHSLYAT